jgi:hypothetical protein
VGPVDEVAKNMSDMTHDRWEGKKKHLLFLESKRSINEYFM